MAERKGESVRQKISAEFAARLDGLGREEKVRAIVLLRSREGDESPAKRQSAGQRQAAVEGMQRSAEQVLESIDGILEQAGGQRLTGRPDALGSIAIEATAAGIKALAASEWVRAVMEDQGIHPVL
jgi:hypothetical protein